MLTTSLIIEIIILIILIVLSGFFSSTETAISMSNIIKVKAMSSEGNKKASRLLRILDNKDKMLSTILICNNVVNLSASALTTAVVIKLFGSRMVGLATGILTFLILVFGEISPKLSAITDPEKMALKNSGIIIALMNILTPVIFIINAIAKFFLRIRGIDPNKKSDTMTETELLTMVEESHRDGVIESDEREMINNVVDFGDTEAKDIMIPWIDVTSVPYDSTYDELIEMFKTNRYTRLPVHGESSDEIKGVLNIKDLLLTDREGFDLGNVITPAYFTFEHKNLRGLLNEMRENSLSIVIVIDEYGTTSGIVTMEDVLEEIVGDISDEYEGRDVEEITEIIPGREYTCLGSVSVDDLNAAAGLDLVQDEYDTVGGYIIEHSDDKIPQVGGSVTTEDGVRLVVKAAKKNRILRVHVYIPEDYSSIDEDY